MLDLWYKNAVIYSHTLETRLFSKPHAGEELVRIEPFVGGMETEDRHGYLAVERYPEIDVLIASGRVFSARTLRP